MAAMSTVSKKLFGGRWMVTVATPSLTGETLTSCWVSVGIVPIFAVTGEACTCGARSAREEQREAHVDLVLDPERAQLRIRPDAEVALQQGGRARQARALGHVVRFHVDGDDPGHAVDRERAGHFQMRQRAADGLAAKGDLGMRVGVQR